LAIVISPDGTARKIREIGAVGHVVLSRRETTRLLDEPPVAAPAQGLSDGQRAAHAFLQPATPSRPLLAHALVTDDHLSDLTVAGAGGTSVDCDEGIADQHLVSGAFLSSAASST
jgi:hypothetical protein